MEPSSLIPLFMNFFKEEIKNAIGSPYEKVSLLLDNDFVEYVDSYYRKFVYSKTFLHRQEKNDFYDLFFPINLHSGRANRVLNISSINELFALSNFISVIGRAGSGKSMLVKHLFLNAIKEKYKIPILLELRKLNDFEGSLFELLSKTILKDHLGKSEKTFSNLLKSGHFVFLFDGYDEIYSSNKESITRSIEEFVDAYSLNSYLITSRPGASIDLLPRFANTYVSDLSNDQILDFTSQQVKIWGKGNEFSERIGEAIFSEENANYLAFLQNPLLLSMYILSFENNPQVPKKKSTFYSNVFHTLCTRHDSISKHGWLHERETKLSIDEVENILEVFCFVSFFRGEYEFTYGHLHSLMSEVNDKLETNFDSSLLIADLEIALSIIMKDGNHYRFPHRSMQEYFAMKYIVNKPDQVKSEVYLKHLPKVQKSSHDSHFNFWSLCYENDRLAFLKYFALGRLKEFVDENASNVSTYMTEFLLEQGVSYKLELKEEEKRLASNGIWSLPVSDFTSVFRFFQISYDLIGGLRPYLDLDLYHEKYEETHSLRKFDFYFEEKEGQTPPLVIDIKYSELIDKDNFNDFNISRTELEAAKEVIYNSLRAAMENIRLRVDEDDRIDSNILKLI